MVAILHQDFERPTENPNTHVVLVMVWNKFFVLCFLLFFYCFSCALYFNSFLLVESVEHATSSYQKHKNVFNIFFFFTSLIWLNTCKSFIIISDAMVHPASLGSWHAPAIYTIQSKYNKNQWFILFWSTHTFY